MRESKILGGNSMLPEKVYVGNIGSATRFVLVVILIVLFILINTNVNTWQGVVMFRGMLFGSVLATAVCLSLFQYLNKDDMEIMTQQHELLNRQQEILLDIQANCDNRNWISFDDEVYVCMPVNQMFHQLSQPPTPQFKFPKENDA